MEIRPFHFRARRGSAAVVMVLILVVLQLVLVTVVLAGGRDQDMMVKRLDSVRAFYASEGGMNIAIKEKRGNSDYDGDGTIGSVSNDGNDANNPTIGNGTVKVTANTTGSTTTILATGSAGSSNRKISTDMLAASTEGQVGYTTPLPLGQDNTDGKQIATQYNFANTGTVTSITAYVRSPNNKNFRFGFYNESASEPNALLAQSYLGDTPNGNNTYYWYTLYLPSTTVSAGNYWLALGVNHGNMEYSYTTTGGQSRMNTNDPTGAGGYSASWGSSSSSNTRQMTIWAMVFQSSIGPLTFSSNAHYENTNPPTSGVFRDINGAAFVQRGNDVSGNAIHYPAINFTTASGLVSDCHSVYDNNPTNTSPSNFTSSLRVSGDVLVSGTSGSRYIGFSALHNETVGQDGICLLWKERAGNDRLQIYRMPQNGGITGTTVLSETATSGIGSEDSWYRLFMDVTITGNTITIDGRIFSHTTANNPNSSVNITPLDKISYTATLASLTGLQTSGQAGVCFDTNDNSSRGSITNLRIDHSPVPGTTALVGSWAEAP